MVSPTKHAARYDDEGQETCRWKVNHRHGHHASYYQSSCEQHGVCFRQGRKGSKINECLHCTDIEGLFTTMSTIVSAVIPDLNSTKAK